LKKLEDKTESALPICGGFEAKGIEGSETWFSAKQKFYLVNKTFCLWKKGEVTFVKNRTFVSRKCSSWQPEGGRYIIFWDFI
jgi:hypothetical protein